MLSTAVCLGLCCVIEPKTEPQQRVVNMNMNHKENPKNFLHYWWFRYLMATELYIVEKWEQATIREYNNII